ncbi:hypothetical protein [Novosphingopyxis sp.]|uniref:hypothetical protein n=1 Tax=Novosphingopyxis sp. TaxID=2709690 RepID=UPI003B5B972D
MRAKADDGSSSAIELTLEGHGEAVPVTIGADGRFALPMFDDDDWEVTSNRPEKAFYIRARVLSPGSREGDWRLGDLQLQCRVSWQLARHESNFAIGALFDAIGGCTSSSIAIYEQLDHPIEAANITEDDKSAALSYSPQFGLRLPTYLKGYSNEARVTVSFAP